MSISKVLSDLYQELPSNVKLVAVSKFHPLEDILEAYNFGQRAFGENRPQEFYSKATTLPSDTEWHFIGHLQTNKLKFVLPYASLIHSVDTLHLLEAIQKWGSANNKTINILLELHLGAEVTKQGFSEDEIVGILQKYQAGAYPNVKIHGIMGMATHTDNPAVIKADFYRINALFNKLKDRFTALNEFKELSIGMSGDYQIAVKAGATIVRIGSKIFN